MSDYVTRTFHISIFGSSTQLLRLNPEESLLQSILYTMNNLLVWITCFLVSIVWTTGVKYFTVGSFSSYQSMSACVYWSSSQKILFSLFFSLWSSSTLSLFSSPSFPPSRPSICGVTLFYFWCWVTSQGCQGEKYCPPWCPAI